MHGKITCNKSLDSASHLVRLFGIDDNVDGRDNIIQHHIMCVSDCWHWYFGVDGAVLVSNDSFNRRLIVDHSVSEPSTMNHHWIVTNAVFNSYNNDSEKLSKIVEQRMTLSFNLVLPGRVSASWHLQCLCLSRQDLFFSFQTEWSSNLINIRQRCSNENFLDLYREDCAAKNLTFPPFYSSVIPSDVQPYSINVIQSFIFFQSNLYSNLHCQLCWW